MKKIIFGLAVLGFFLSTSTTKAQIAPITPICGTCYFTSASMTLGSTDASTGGQVTIIQSFLISKGLLTMPVGVSQGYFGFLTRSALAKFQASVGISPAVGYFGPITRGYVNSHCVGNSGTTINSLSASAGPIGMQVTIFGSGFSSTGNTVNFGYGIIKNISSTNANGTSLTFTVPTNISPACTYSNPPCLIATQITPSGTYNISVTNASGIRSNELSFNVTSNVSGTAPVINSVSTPTYLDVNQTGTWTVNASDSQNGTLTYSADWGTVSNCSPNLVCIQPIIELNSASVSFQQTATFTHVYSSPGTYTQTFFVKNSNGQTAQTTTTVKVGNYAPGIY